VARSRSGLALAWGAGHCSGQGVLGSHADALAPQIIPRTKEMDVTAVAAGGLHAVLLTRDGGAYTWGWGGCGQLGLGRRTGEAEVVRDPTRVDTQSQTISMVACGAYHTALVEVGGELMTFGAGGKRWVAAAAEGGTLAGRKVGGVASEPRVASPPGSRESRGKEAGDTGESRDAQGFTKEERAAFNLELSTRAMNISTASDAGYADRGQEGYHQYVVRRREKLPDGTLTFKKDLMDLQQKETKELRINNILKREGGTDDEIAERRDQEKAAKWDRKVDRLWSGIMLWVSYMISLSNPMPAVRRVAGRCCCTKKPLADGNRARTSRGRTLVWP